MTPISQEHVLYRLETHLRKIQALINDISADLDDIDDDGLHNMLMDKLMELRNVRARLFGEVVRQRHKLEAERMNDGTTNAAPEL